MILLKVINQIILSYCILYEFITVSLCIKKNYKSLKIQLAKNTEEHYLFGCIKLKLLAGLFKKLPQKKFFFGWGGRSNLKQLKLKNGVG